MSRYNKLPRITKPIPPSFESALEKSLTAKSLANYHKVTKGKIARYDILVIANNPTWAYNYIGSPIVPWINLSVWRKNATKTHWLLLPLQTWNGRYMESLNPHLPTLWLWCWHRLLPRHQQNPFPLRQPPIRLPLRQTPHPTLTNFRLHLLRLLRNWLRRLTPK